MKKAVVILTEGPQDAAFIYYLLKENNFMDFKAKMNEEEMPIFEIIKKHINEIYPDNKEIQVDNWQLALPYLITKNENNDFCIIYSIGGKDKSEQAKSILKKYFDAFFGNNQLFENMTFAIIYDADSNLSDAIKSIKDNYSSFEKQSKKRQVPNFESKTINYKLNLSNISHNTISQIAVTLGETIKNINFGFYFFPGSQPQNVGTLEFLALPIMQENNKELFEKTEKFILENNTNFLTSSFNFEDKEKTLKDRITKTAKYYKTIVGIVGQFNIAGSSSSVFYKNGVYLKDKINDISKLEQEQIDELIGLEQCKEIVKLINDLLKD